MLLAFAETPNKPHSVFTTHNVAFQGNFPADVLPAIGVPDCCYRNGDIEFYGRASFLKAGRRYADRVTTVSPTYAGEILTPEFGFGREGVLQARGAEFSGILNGIDDASWDPSKDIHIAQPFHASDVSGKRLCKSALQRKFGLPVDPSAPLIGFVSRIAHQKMADVILSALPHIVERGAQFVLVGEGDAALENGFRGAQARFRNDISVHIGYDEALAHRLHAGSDMLLAPARFEPCGLTQLYAMRYGTLPIVRKTGGLADTVTDAAPAAITDRTATGFVFEEASLEGLVATVGRALALYRKPLMWRRVQMQAMARDFSWDTSAGNYISLYSDLAGIAPPSSAFGVTSEEAAQDIAAEESVTEKIVGQRSAGCSHRIFQKSLMPAE
jgi:starch synthase